jgi:hypothetical protein
VFVGFSADQKRLSKMLDSPEVAHMWGNLA